MHRVHALVACGLAVLLTFSLCLAFPLRARGDDTLPGRLGAATLACAGDHDLSRIPSVQRDAIRNGVPYWLMISRDGRHLVSTWGPGPAWAGWLAFASLEKGAVVTDLELRRLARYSAAAALALTAGLLCLGLLRWLSPLRSLVWALGFASSCAGAGTLGQALWQQTVALPLLVAALASLAWEEARWPLVLCPTLLATLTLMRPAEVFLVLPIGLLWLVRARSRLSLRFVTLALALALVASLPFVAWNLRYFDLPFSPGQWEKNRFSPLTQFPVAFFGLLVSPGRGALWFAPVLVAMLAFAAIQLRGRGPAAFDLLVAGILAQTIVVACFRLWWGGYVSFGPRLLALPLWASAVWLASSWKALPLRSRRVVEAALGLTALVGLAGGILFDPAKWDHSNDATKLWQIVDSPLPSLVRTARSTFTDSFGPGPFVYCDGERVLTAIER